MAILCKVCGYDKTPDTSQFCDACGAELPMNNQDIINDLVTENTAETSSDGGENSSDLSTTKSPEPNLTPYLIAKDKNASIPEFCLENYNLIGIFDPDTGPVDIDLETFIGAETVSRQHAEIYQEAGNWKIKDLGSTNGVFIKPLGEKRFNARITSPTIINHGDEVAIAKVRFLFQLN